jgi:nicotinamidase-related amidase
LYHLFLTSFFQLLTILNVMPARNFKLHGNVPDKSDKVLILIDVINDLEFDTGPQLLKTALPAAQKIAALKDRCKNKRIPVIYCNDNFGRWKSDFNQQVQHCVEDGVRGKPLSLLLKPDEDDYFVLKPKHSAFYSTTLDLLLQYLGAKTLILTGFTGDICVLFTAHDAYMRDFNMIIPQDCIASSSAESNAQALSQMEKILKADTRSSQELKL